MPDYPRPSLTDYLLFHTPWPGLILFALVALILAWLALRRRSRGLAIAAAVTALIAAVFPLLSSTVTTTSERLTERTRLLIDGVVNPDTASFASLFTEQVALEAPEGNVENEGRTELIERIEFVSKRYPVVDYTVTNLDGGLVEAGRARSFLKILTRHEGGGGFYAGTEAAALTGWLMDWRLVDGQWRITRIVMHSLNNQPPTRHTIP